MNTAVILGGCLTVLAAMLVVLFRTSPDDEHSLDASRRRHPSTRQPTHVRRTPRPYDWARDEEGTP